MTAARNAFLFLRGRWFLPGVETSLSAGLNRASRKSEDAACATNRRTASRATRAFSESTACAWRRETSSDSTRRARAEFRRGAQVGEYAAALRRGAWGDELCLQAAAAAFGVVVHVVTAHDANWCLAYRPDAGADVGARSCFLSYVHPVHYNALGLA